MIQAYASVCLYLDLDISEVYSDDAVQRGVKRVPDECYSDRN